MTKIERLVNIGHQLKLATKLEETLENNPEALIIEGEKPVYLGNGDLGKMVCANLRQTIIDFKSQVTGGVDFKDVA